MLGAAIVWLVLGAVGSLIMLDYFGVKHFPWVLGVLAIALGPLNLLAAMIISDAR